MRYVLQLVRFTKINGGSCKNHVYYCPREFSRIYCNNQAGKPHDKTHPPGKVSLIVTVWLQRVTFSDSKTTHALYVLAAVPVTLRNPYR